MNGYIRRQDVFNEILKVSNYIDNEMLIRLYIELNMLPSAQPEHEYIMEEFMYGQEMGNFEDGSL